MPRSAGCARAAAGTTSDIQYYFVGFRRCAATPNLRRLIHPDSFVFAHRAHATNKNAPRIHPRGVFLHKGAPV